MAEVVTGALGLLVPGDMIQLDGRSVQVVATRSTIVQPQGAQGAEIDWVDPSCGDELTDSDTGTIVGENRQLVVMVVTE